MIRTFGVQTLGAAAQPWFADALTAAIAAQPSNYNDGQTTTPVKVASSALYRVGDYLILSAGTANQERVTIVQIPNGTTLNVTFCTKAHASGDVIALDIFCYNVSIQLLDGGTGVAYLGTDNTVTAAPGGTAFYELQKEATGTLPAQWEYSPSGNNNCRNTADGWIVGTAGDKYLAAAYVV